MLSADCSHRLMTLLNQVIHNCKEEEKILEDQLRKYHVLLRPWKTDKNEDKEQDEEPSGSLAFQTDPSQEEMQDVEMLNKALEKALKVRARSRPESTGCALHTQVKPTCPPTKAKSQKSSSKSSCCGTKPVTYQLNPPYKTYPENRRAREGSSRGASNDKTAHLTTAISSCPTERDVCGTVRQSEPGEGSSTEGMLGKSASNSLTHQEVQDPQPFTLKNKGCTLRLPAEYRRLYSQNSKLWERFYEIQNHPSPESSFIQNLQMTFSPGCPTMSLSELEEETSRLETAVTRMRQSIESVEKWQGTGPKQWHSYRLMLVYEALQKEVSKHISALEPIKLAAEQHCTWNGGEPTATSCAEPRGCPILTRTAPPILVYQNPKELSQLMHRQLRVLELKQKIHLQKVLNKELLLEMKSQCHNAPESWLLYRAIYTLLCEGGGTFPVLVHEDN
ncbi:tubulin epsilon and delta complex protein 2 [Pelodytes ibericus]